MCFCRSSSWFVVVSKEESHQSIKNKQSNRYVRAGRVWPFHSQVESGQGVRCSLLLAACLRDGGMRNDDRVLLLSLYRLLSEREISNFGGWGEDKGGSDTTVLRKWGIFPKPRREFAVNDSIQQKGLK